MKYFSIYGSERMNEKKIKLSSCLRRSAENRPSLLASKLGEELIELHRGLQTALDLELARHVGTGRLQLPRKQLLEVVAVHIQGGQHFTSPWRFPLSNLAALHIHKPFL
ncbi:hypothetical protein RvY_14970, partial [Ramazzottius varieornatus]